MRKKDFIRNRKEFIKRFKRNDWIYSALFMAILILNWLAVSVWDVLDGVDDRWIWFYLILFFAFLIGNIFAINKFHKNQIHNSGLTCESCSEPLIAEQADIAVATESCPNCGERAFANDS